MKQFVFRWAATTVAVMVASSIIRCIRYDTIAALIETDAERFARDLADVVGAGVIGAQA